MIPYGVDDKRFFTNLKIGEDLEFVARANTLTKGGAVFLRALSRLRGDLVDRLGVESLKITILGDLDVVVAKLLRELKFDTRIHFCHGSVPGSDVPELLRRASLFIMPSLSESMSLACIEAMQSGLPLAVTPFVGVDCFKRDDMGVEFLPTVDSIAEALLFVADNKDMWPKWGRAAALAAKSLSWKSYENSINKFAASI